MIISGKNLVNLYNIGVKNCLAIVQDNVYNMKTAYITKYLYKNNLNRHY